jgi:hypothetical protein
MIIQEDGTCSVDAVNFADATCTQATKEIMHALAGHVEDERLKPEAQRLPPLTNGRKEGAR